MGGPQLREVIVGLFLAVVDIIYRIDMFHRGIKARLFETFSKHFVNLGVLCAFESCSEIRSSDQIVNEAFYLVFGPS